METIKSLAGLAKDTSTASNARLLHYGGKVLPFKSNVSDHSLNDKELLSAQRVEFIETLSQEFFLIKGYGVFAYLSTIEVIRLFERFLNKGISARAFAKEYVRSF